uniref:Uncharacterized protein n=1 Tax=Anguilla anguilla TaxID=7936 RepID=A0A0E9V2Z2_ANGAN
MEGEWGLEKRWTAFIILIKCTVQKRNKKTNKTLEI